MGTGIAIVAARKQIADKIIILDSYASTLMKSQTFVDAWTDKEITKGRLSA